MLYREIIAVCSQIHTKHIKTLCGQNVEFGMLNPLVTICGTYSDQWFFFFNLRKSSFEYLIYHR